MNEIGIITEKKSIYSWHWQIVLYFVQNVHYENLIQEIAIYLLQFPNNFLKDIQLLKRMIDKFINFQLLDTEWT